MAGYGEQLVMQIHIRDVESRSWTDAMPKGDELGHLVLSARNQLMRTSVGRVTTERLETALAVKGVLLLLFPLH